MENGLSTNALPVLFALLNMQNKKPVVK